MEVSPERIHKMILDFVKRSKVRYTSEQVAETMASGKTLILEDGFMTLDIYQDELHVLLMYIRPGADLLPVFEYAAEDIARHCGCRVIRFLSRRKPGAIVRTRPGYKPVAIMYERELR